MDIFNFCWMTLLDESKKCSVFFDKNTFNVRNDIDENFAKPIKRISYLYKYGSYNISFFHQCFKEFFTKASDSLKIIDNMRSLKNLTVCSMSIGPGLDIVGLLYSLYSIDKPLVNPVTFKVISRHTSWGNVVSEMINSSIISVPNASSCKLIQCNFFKNLSRKALSCLKNADVLLMCNSLSSSGVPENVICDRLKIIIQLLKPGALLFFIASKEKSTYFEQLESFGSFLYGPVEVTLENMPYNEKIVEIVGVKPLCSGTSVFCVWQKSHEIKCEANFQNDSENSVTIEPHQHSSTKVMGCKTHVEDNNSAIFNMPSMKKELSSESIASSSWLSSSSSVSSETIKVKDKPAVFENSVNSTEQNYDISEIIYDSAKTTSAKSLNTSDSEFRKKNISPCSSGLKNEENNENINNHLKNLENLITKLEGSTTSQDPFNNYYIKEELSSSEHKQSKHQGNCRFSTRQCQFTENNLTCCHTAMCCCDSYVGNHNSSMSVASNSFRNLPQEGPCIVIPLKNLSNESVAQILSIISQNNSSVNQTTSSLPLKKENS